jgi:DNA-binding MarR family transcriptional regulator
MSARSEMYGELALVIQRQTMWTVLLHNTVAGKAGINVTDMQCVNLLILEGPLTPGQLAKAMGVTTGGAITAVVDRLERAGFVKRTRDADDRRRVIVELEPGKVEHLGSYFEPMGRAFVERLAAYTDEQIAFLLEFGKSSNERMPAIIEEVQALP